MFLLSLPLFVVAFFTFFCSFVTWRVSSSFLKLSNQKFLHQRDLSPSFTFQRRISTFSKSICTFLSLWYAWHLCIISEIMGNNSYFTPYFPIFGDKLNQSSFLLHLYFKRKLCPASYGMLRVARMLLITCQCIGRHCQRHWAWSGVTGQVTLVVLRLARWRQVAGHRFTCWGHCHSSKGALDGGKGGNAKTNWDGVCIV